MREWVAGRGVDDAAGYDSNVLSDTVRVPLAHGGRRRHQDDREKNDGQAAEGARRSNYVGESPVMNAAHFVSVIDEGS
ncbi:MAG: hypothetical protein WD031_00205, partial [Gemmatimonadota bacterium]